MGTRPADRSPHFMLVPSLSCPGQCGYCFGPRSGPVMDQAAMLAAVDWIGRAAKEGAPGPVRITFHGGEPLAAGHALWRSMLGRLAESLPDRDLKLSLQSNLWLLDDEYCRIFNRYKVEIGTSLDGPADLTDAQRGSGYFARTMTGVARARGSGLDVACIATFTPQSASRVPEVFDFFLSQRLHFSVHAAVRSLGQRLSGYELSSEAYGRVLLELLDLYLDRRRETRVTLLDEMISGVAEGHGCVCTFQDCLGLFHAIDPQGDIFPCQRMCGRPEYRLGRVADAPSIRELLESPMARRLAAHKRAVREECAACDHVAYCAGGCPYNAWAGGESLRDPLCEAYRTIYDEIWRRALGEMEAEDNLALVASGPWDRRSPFLLRKGPLAELARRGPHPTEVARSARRVVAANELARDRERAAGRLLAAGICRTPSSARASLAALESQIRPSRLPLNKVYLHVTFRCSLGCNHCYVPADPHGAGMEDMPVEAVSRVLAQAHDAGFRRVIVTGGEPLCHSNRDDLLAALAAACGALRPLTIGLRSSLAMAADSDLLMRIAAAADQLGVSIDGDREFHDARRGPGRFDATVANLERYLALTKDVPGAAAVMLAAVLSAEEAQGEPGRAVWSLADRLEVSKVGISPPLPLGRALQWASPRVMEARAAHLDPDEVVANGFAPVGSCGLGGVLYILPDGSAYPCRALRLPEWRLGNVLSDGLAAVLESQRFLFLQSRSVDTNQGCRNCEVRYICGGPCHAWRETPETCDVDAAPLDCSRREQNARRILAAARQYLGLPYSPPPNAVP